MAQTLDALIIELRADIKGLQAGLTDAQGKVKRFSTQADKDISTIRASLDRVRNSVVALGGAWAAFRVGKGIVEAGMQIQAMQFRMEAATGSAAVAANAMAFVRSEAERLGLDMRATADGFSSFAAAGLRAGLTLEETKTIFTGVSEAATALHLSSERTSLVFAALGQMASKGTVSMEELRQQMGESLPGALQIFAKAMGVSTEKFISMVEAGEVLTPDLRKLGDELHRQFGERAVASATSAQAAFNRMGNALFELQAKLANAGLLDAVTDAVVKLTEAMNDPQLQAGLANFVEGMGEAIGYAVQLAAAIGNLNSQVKAAADAGMEKVFGSKFGDAVARERNRQELESTFSDRVLGDYITQFNAKGAAAGQGVSGGYTLGTPGTGQSKAAQEAAAKAQKMRESLLEQVNNIHYANSDDTEQEKLKFEEQLKTLKAALDAKAITQQEYRDLEAEAEAAHQDRLTGIREDAEAKDLANKQRISDIKRSMEEKTLNSIHNLIQVFAGKNKAVALALLAFDKARAIAQAVIETHVAAAAALKYDPTGATSAYVTTLGYANVAAIAATGIAEAAMMGRSGGSDGGYTSSSSGYLPTSDSGAGSSTTATMEKTVYLTLQGDRLVFSREDVRSIIDQINEAVGDGTRLVVSQ